MANYNTSRYIETSHSYGYPVPSRYPFESKNWEVLMTETSIDTAYPSASKSASIIALLAGIWFFVSPWVYGAYLLENAWNNWIVGIVVTILAIIRLSSTDLKLTQWASWINCFFGIWAFVSPWIFLY